MDVNQMAGGEIMGIRGIRQDGAPSPGLDRENSGLGVTRAEILHDAEQDTVSVRQHLGPTVPLLLTGRVWKCHDLDLPAILLDPRQSRPVATVIDIPVRAPGGASHPEGYRRRDLHYRSALDRNFLYRGRGNEPDPLPIRREERHIRVFGAWNGSSFKLVYTAQIQPGRRRVRAPDCIRQTLTIG